MSNADIIGGAIVALIFLVVFGGGIASAVRGYRITERKQYLIARGWERHVKQTVGDEWIVYYTKGTESWPPKEAYQLQRKWDAEPPRPYPYAEHYRLGDFARDDDAKE